MHPDSQLLFGEHQRPKFTSTPCAHLCSVRHCPPAPLLCCWDPSQSQNKPQDKTERGYFTQEAHNISCEPFCQQRLMEKDR